MSLEDTSQIIFGAEELCFKVTVVNVLRPSTLSCKIVGTLWCFSDMPITFPLFRLIWKRFYGKSPTTLNQCCLTFLFIPKPAIEWTLTLRPITGGFQPGLEFQPVLVGWVFLAIIWAYSARAEFPMSWFFPFYRRRTSTAVHNILQTLIFSPGWHKLPIT